MSYGTSLIGTVVENLQIEINSVHIRYEDDISIPGRPFACGFYLESLAAQTCDDAWSPKFVHRDPAAPSQQIMAFKLVELQNMAAYFNFDCDMLGDLDVKELKEKSGCVVLGTNTLPPMNDNNRINEILPWWDNREPT